VVDNGDLAVRVADQLGGLQRTPGEPNAGPPHKQTGSRWDVMMSGVVGSGRQIGLGNIDANDPKPTLASAELIFSKGRPQITVQCPAAQAQ
jgi:hypothetical protein